MSTVRPPAITGVSINQESVLETEFPSVASAAIGRALGMLYESIPVQINGIKLSHVFALATAPLGIVGYLQLKVFGRKYVLTTQSLQVRTALTGEIREQISLDQIEDIAVVQQAGQEFYKAADLYVTNAAGESILVLAGVTRPDRFRRVILEAAHVRRSVAASLATLEGRE